MKRSIFLTLSVPVFALSVVDVFAVGFTHVVPTNGQPVDIGIWYPSESAIPSKPNTPFGLALAIDAEPAGTDLPLVVISHGNAGWMGSHADTAMALAEAGFVVAAITHADDNYQNDGASPSKWVVSRPMEITSAIDFLTERWSGADVISAERIGVFGFSAGGYTAMVAAGGVPDFDQAARYCDENPTDFVCQIGLVEEITTNGANERLLDFTKDQRIRAVSAAAPGLGFAFNAEALKEVDIPVQIWSGALDERVPHATNGKVLADALKTRATVEVVEGAGHFAFLSPCRAELESANPRIWEMICVDEPGFNRAAFHTTLNKSIVEFFNDALAW